MEEYLNKTYYGNTTEQYLIAAAIVLGGLLIMGVAKRILIFKLKKLTEKTETKLDDYVVKALEKFGIPILTVVVVSAGLHFLSWPEKIEKIIDAALTVVLTFYGVRLVSAVIRLALESFISRQEKGEEKLKQLNGIMIIINVLVWTIGLLFLFDNLGYNVTAIITGLGIGGIAIALAAQNILGDLFNYFVIFFDRPFEVGDFIVVDDKKGTVEHIGIKTTRLKSLTGEQLAFANSDLTKSRIHNFKRMDRRRIVFQVGVVYQTPAEVVEEIPALLKKILDEHPQATLDRAHFASFGNFSLNFEVVYFVESSEYNDYMDIQQSINLKIFKEFAARKIEFAYPTQTIFMAK
ncbi:MAG: mechanosensitive ion channel family protein [Bacteroidota bacterium]